MTDVSQETAIHLPEVNAHAGFVGADACQECHKSEFDTWHVSYHRTMTQPATPESVVPDFDGVELVSHGRTYRLERRGEEFWVDTISPAAEVRAFLDQKQNEVENLPRETRQIVMTTGSHRHQTYWMQNANGTFIQFPWVYHIDTDRWVFRTNSFLRPETDKVTFNIWNMHCTGCHSTGAAPSIDRSTNTMFSQGELGISCEACHGPGAEHVAWANTSPKSGDPAIAHPAKMNAQLSGEVCGQCHSMSQIRNEAHWYTVGNSYRPGQGGFEDVREIYEMKEDVVRETEEFGTSIKTRFWPDGTIRTGGREHNGLIKSKCYTHGIGDRQMSCLSCHSLHNYHSPNKQLSGTLSQQQTCQKCHTEEKYNSDLAAHTHHPIDSSASQCVNCHMPRTSYALFSATRSHRIQSPKVRPENEAGQPNACNLCHLNQTKQWSADHLASWWQIETPELNDDEKSIAAGAYWALKGDAAQRAITAWHYRWDEAKAISGTSWMPPVLTNLLDDSYFAVRYLAYESLKTLEGYSELNYEPAMTEETRQKLMNEVLGEYAARHVDLPEDGLQAVPAAQVLLNPSGNSNREIIQRLVQEQDERPIAIVE